MTMVSVDRDTGDLPTETFKNRTMDKNATLKLTLALFIICQFLSSVRAETCDVVYKIQTDVYPILLNLTEGQRICIEDEYGETASLLFTHFEMRTTYKLAYYTSDYDVILETPLGTPCKNIDEPDEKSTAALSQFRCSYNSSTFTNDCKVSQGIKQKGDIYGVYQGTKEWTFQVSGVNYAEKITLQENGDFSLNLESFGLLGVKEMSLSFVGWNLDRPRSLLEFQGEFYYVDSAPSGRREIGRFGEYQTDERNILDVHAVLEQVSCEPQSLYFTCDCTARRSMIGRLIKEGTSHLLQRRSFVVENSFVDVFDGREMGDVWVQLSVAQLGVSLRRYVKDMRVKSVQKPKAKGCDLYSWDKGKLIEELGYEDRPSCYFTAGQGDEHDTLWCCSEGKCKITYFSFTPIETQQEVGYCRVSTYSSKNSASAETILNFPLNPGDTEEELSVTLSRLDWFDWSNVIFIISVIVTIVLLVVAVVLYNLKLKALEKS